MGDPTSISVLAGGVGAARMLRGLVAAYPDAAITAIVNVGRRRRGQRTATSRPTSTRSCTRSPGQIDADRGWGLAGETWQAMEALRRYARAAGAIRHRLVQSRRPRPRHPPVPHHAASPRVLHFRRSPTEMAPRGTLPLTVLPVTDDRVATRLRTDRRRARVPGVLRPRAPRRRRSARSGSMVPTWLARPRACSRRSRTPT